MSIPKLYDHKKYMHKSTSATPTTKGDMYQLFDNYGTITENMVAVTLWQPATAYTAGAVVKSPSLPTGYVARCKTAGTSSEEEPSWKAGDITDNGVTWTVTKAVLVADLATSDEAKAGTATDKIITASTLKAAMDAAISTAVAAAMKQAKLDAHPVGSYYFSDDSTSPADLFGGTWEALPAGYTLIAQGSGTDDYGSFTYTAGQKYGERKHQLTTDEMPEHSHTGTTSTTGAHKHGTWGGSQKSGTPPYGYYDKNSNHSGSSGGIDNDNTLYNTSTDGDHSHTFTTDTTGGNRPHNNLPPSIASYGWRRTA